MPSDCVLPADVRGNTPVLRLVVVLLWFPFEHDQTSLGQRQESRCLQPQMKHKLESEFRQNSIVHLSRPCSGFCALLSFFGVWDFQGMERPEDCFRGFRVYLGWQDAKGRHLMPRKTSLCPNSSCNAVHVPGDRPFTALVCVLQTQWLVRLSRVVCANIVGEQVLWHHVFVDKSLDWSGAIFAECKGFPFCFGQGNIESIDKLLNRMLWSVSTSIAMMERAMITAVCH